MVTAPPRHTVSQVLELLQGSLRRAFPTMLVEGEVVDPQLSRNGHFYFRLRDSGGELKGVMWRRDAQRMRTRPQAGDKITARGSLALYPARGELQFVATALMRSGKGQKLAELRELKQRLRAEGLLDRVKRPLPARVKRLGLVTSVGSAVLHDVHQTLRRRDPSLELWLSPASVSGPAAARELTLALERLRGVVEVVIIARGGGSFEELLPFSDERLVRAAASYPVPLVCAVGHGSDLTLLDLVADQTAATPSAAAELCSSLRAELMAEHQRLRERLVSTVSAQLERRRSALSTLSRLCRANHPAGRLARHRDEVRHLHQRLETEIVRLLQVRRAELESLRRSCLAMGPQSVLERGFALVTSEGVPVTQVAGRRPGEELELHLADGKMRVTILDVSSPPYD